MPKSKNKTTTASDGSGTAGIDGKSAKNGNSQADNDTLNNQGGGGAAAVTSKVVGTSISVDKKDSIDDTSTSTTTTEKEDGGPVKQQSPDNAGKEVANTNNKNGKDKDNNDSC